MDRLTRAFVLLIQVLFLALAGARFVSDALAQQPTARQDKVFKGDAKCTRCHDEEDDYAVLDIANTRHGGAARTSGMTCTSCHGESDSHINKPANATERPKPDRVFGNKGARVTPPAVREQACLTCHASDRHLAFWESGRHKKN